MADEYLNQLLEQATGKCDELANLIDSANEAVESCVENAGNVGEAIEDGTGDLRDALKSLTERLEEAKGDIADARAPAESALDTVESTAGSVEKDLDTLVADAKQKSTEIEAALKEVDGALEDAAQQITGGFKEVGSNLEQLSKETADRVQGVKDAIESFGSTVDAAKADLEQSKEAWLKALDALTTEATTQVKGAVEGMASILRASGTGVVELVNGVIMEHNPVMEAIGKTWAEDAVQQLDQLVPALVEELTTLAQVAGQRREELGGKAQEILDRIVSLVPEITEVTDELLNAKRI